MLLPESPLDRTTHDLGTFTTFPRVLKIDKLDMSVSISRDEYNERIKELQPWFNGEYVVILRNGTRLTLSRGYREKLQERLGKPL